MKPSRLETACKVTVRPFAFASLGDIVLPCRRVSAGAAHRGDRSRSLDPFDCSEPGRCAVVVESGLNPVRFDGDDFPPTAGVERRSQLFLTNGMRAGIGTIVTEAQHIQGTIVL